MEADDDQRTACARDSAAWLRDLHGPGALVEAYRHMLDAILAADRRHVDHANRVIEALLGDHADPRCDRRANG